MQKYTFTLIFLLIPAISFATDVIEGQVVSITSREIVEKLAVLEGKFLSVDQQFIAVNQKIDQKFEAVDQKFIAVNQKIDQKFEAVDQKFEAINQKIDQIAKAFNQRINDLIESVNSRFSIFQWIIGGMLLGMIYLMRMIFKMPDLIISRIQEMKLNEVPSEVIEQKVQEFIRKEEKQSDRLLLETVETLKVNLDNVIDYLKNNTNFKALAPQPV